MVVVYLLGIPICCGTDTALKTRDVDKTVMFGGDLSENADSSKDKRNIYKYHKLSKEDKASLYANRPDLDPKQSPTGRSKAASIMTEPLLSTKERDEINQTSTTNPVLDGGILSLSIDQGGENSSLGHQIIEAAVTIVEEVNGVRDADAISAVPFVRSSTPRVLRGSKDLTGKFVLNPTSSRQRQNDEDEQGGEEGDASEDGDASSSDDEADHEDLALKLPVEAVFSSSYRAGSSP